MFELNFSAGLRKVGLQLCDNNSSSNSAQCSKSTNRCKGTNYNTCDLYRPWGELSSSSGGHTLYYKDGFLSLEEDGGHGAYSICYISRL